MKRFYVLLLSIAFMFTIAGCSSEPVVIEATPEQQQTFADEYAAEMQSRG